MILGWENSQAGFYSHCPALTISGKTRPILAGLDSAPSPAKCLPTRHEQLRGWPYNTPRPGPEAGSTEGALCRMTRHQISHRLPLLVLLLLLIKDGLIGISLPLCGVPLLCPLASGCLEVFRSISWMGKSLSLNHSSWIHSHSQKPSISFS